AAQRVSLLGPFNAWSGRAHGMRPVGRSGVWELFLPGVGDGTLYKYEIRTKHGGRRIVKSDPFARAAELRPHTASVVAPSRAFRWGDARWLSSREKRQGVHAPVSIYEVHVGSWRRAHPDAGNAAPADTADADANWLTWDELAESMVPWAKDAGFTHLELMPVTEHPFDGSWGYQTTGYFAPTARFGEPDGLKRFVNAAHRAGLGVLLDWVPAHFPRDAHGPAFFDGTHLFEHEDPLRRTHPDWETYVFDWSRGPVRSFLVSSALYWLRDFHFDGLRVDAVASMLYLDYSRNAGEWRPNPDGGRENWDAVAFLRTLNDAVHTCCPGAITAAEESTAWPGVTAPTSRRGLGFDLKWNMGWMNDTLSFFRTEPRMRPAVLRKLTFSLTYAFSERYLLPLSHDEVVHGKASLVSKMPGTREERFANLRALYGLMWAHPGKKLLFMGAEFAPWTEWNHDGELEWGLLEHEGHKGMREWVAHLNEVYRKRPAFHGADDSWDGFRWVEIADPARCALAFLRLAKGRRPALVVANLSA
ncbi:1,4-alpha-glucan branching protein GlgB, partial [bacterium]|nr:1,4-alpha-glucan branching protein GlgB [bacterium]